MSVLIKGMDMPEYEKIIVVYPDGYTKLYMRSDMLEVPTPHGRLIDADALSIATLSCKYWNNADEVVAWELVRDAPTVIEAEGK